MFGIRVPFNLYMLYLFLGYVKLFQNIRARQSISEKDEKALKFRLYERMILGFYIVMYLVRVLFKDILTPIIAELGY